MLIDLMYKHRQMYILKQKKKLLLNNIKKMHKNIENVEFSIVPYVFCLLFYNLLYNKRSNRTIQL